MTSKRLVFGFGALGFVVLMACALAFALVPETIKYSRGSFQDWLFTPELLEVLLPENPEDLLFFHSYAEEAAPDMDGAEFVESHSEQFIRERVHRILSARGFELNEGMEYEIDPMGANWKVVKVGTIEIDPERTEVYLTVRHMDSLL